MPKASLEYELPAAIYRKKVYRVDWQTVIVSDSSALNVPPRIAVR